MVKPDLDTLLTVPDEPPAAGPERALDPPPTNRGPPAGTLLDVDGAADAGEDSTRPRESPMMGTNSVAATMVRHFFFVSNGRTLARGTNLVVGIEADRSAKDEGGESASAPALLAAAEGPDVVFGAGRLGRWSWFVASRSS